MEVRLISKTNIREDAESLTSRKDAFDDVIQRIENADWNIPGDIPKTLAGANIIGKNRVTINLKGNQYRMICHYKFKDKYVYFYYCWAGTHEDYDQLCDPSSEPTQYTIWKY